MAKKKKSDDESDDETLEIELYGRKVQVPRGDMAESEWNDLKAKAGGTEARVARNASVVDSVLDEPRDERKAREYAEETDSEYVAPKKTVYDRERDYDVKGEINKILDESGILRSSDEDMAYGRKMDRARADADDRRADRIYDVREPDVERPQVGRPALRPIEQGQRPSEYDTRRERREGSYVPVREPRDDRRPLEFGDLEMRKYDPRREGEVPRVRAPRDDSPRQAQPDVKDEVYRILGDAGLIKTNRDGSKSQFGSSPDDNAPLARSEDRDGDGIKDAVYEVLGEAGIVRQNRDGSHSQFGSSPDDSKSGGQAQGVRRMVGDMVKGANSMDEFPERKGDNVGTRVATSDEGGSPPPRSRFERAQINPNDDTDDGQGGKRRTPNFVASITGENAKTKTPDAGYSPDAGYNPDALPQRRGGDAGTAVSTDGGVPTVQQPANMAQVQQDQVRAGPQPGFFGGLSQTMGGMGQTIGQAIGPDSPGAPPPMPPPDMQGMMGGGAPEGSMSASVSATVPGQAPQIQSSDYLPPGYEGERKRLMNERVKAQGESAKIQSDAFSKMADLHKQQADAAVESQGRLQKQHEAGLARQQTVIDHMQKMQKIMSDPTKTPDPERYWQNHSKIWFAIGVGLMMANKKDPSAIINSVNNAIKNDIAQQRDEFNEPKDRAQKALEADRNFYAILRNQGLDAFEAERVGQTLLSQQLQAQIKQTAAASDSQLVKANSQDMLLQLQQKEQQDMAEVLQHARQVGIQEQHVKNEAVNAETARYTAEQKASGDQRKLTEQERKAALMARQGIETVRELRKILGPPKGLGGALAESASANVPLVMTKAKEKQRAVSALNFKLATAISQSALQAHEQKFWVGEDGKGGILGNVGLENMSQSQLDALEKDLENSLYVAEHGEQTSTGPQIRMGAVR